MVLLDLDSLAGAAADLDPWVTLVSPDEELLAALDGHHRGRGLHAGFRPTCAPAVTGPTCGAQLLRRGLERGLDVVFDTVHDEAYRPHEVWRHRDRHPRRGRRAGARRARPRNGASRPVRRAGAGTSAKPRERKTISPAQGRKILKTQRVRRELLTWGTGRASTNIRTPIAAMLPAANANFRAGT